MATITFLCKDCKKYNELEIYPQLNISCPSCQKHLGTVQNPDSIFQSCPICQCDQFYTQKDFNQALGCLIMLAGIILVPVTYGLSLPFFALIDWLFYRKVPTMAVCYKCGSEFRGAAIPPNFKHFMHHIGVKYDKFR